MHVRSDRRPGARRQPDEREHPVVQVLGEQATWGEFHKARRGASEGQVERKRRPSAARGDGASRTYQSPRKQEGTWREVVRQRQREPGSAVVKTRASGVALG